MIPSPRLTFKDWAIMQIGYPLGVLICYAINAYDARSAVTALVATHFSSLTTWWLCRRLVAERERERNELLESFE